ncbi:MAG: TIGR02646 family protein [Desulfobacteraceae bacterium]|nr:TIGR02646 family protein [Desulfobacteraceae bacterium]
MKFIVKQSEPEEFRKWKEMANENWQPAYKGLSGDPKNKVHESLLKEQGYICCYCNRYIDHKSSHIEHLVPQSEDKSRELDYNNLLASCQRRTEPKEPRHCGVLKADWYDSSLMIAPLDNNCEMRFSFIEDGQIVSHDDNDNAAKETIRRLGLGIDKLKKCVRKLLSRLLRCSVRINSIPKIFKTGLKV